jgi:CubicO group peptidase (beta-lactamase class C family)
MMKVLLGVVLAVSLLGAVPAAAQELPRGEPQELGFSPERLEHITSVLGDDAGGGKIPGAVLLIARHGRIAYFEAVGMLDPQTKEPMPKNAIFRIYSMTKPITQVMAMMLFEEGRFTLDDALAKYLPQFKDMNVGVETTGPDGSTRLELVPATRPIRIQDLMRHTSGITYGFFGHSLVNKAYLAADLANPELTDAEVTDRIARLPLAFEPATTWVYGHSTQVLGRLIEVLCQHSLYEVENERLLQPLGMKDTGFYVTDPAKQRRIAEPYPNDRTLGIGLSMNDPRVVGKQEPGDAGMVGTATDYADFLQMLLNSGALGGKRYLGPATVAYMTADQLGDIIAPGPQYLPGPGYGYGLGFEVRVQRGLAPYAGSPGEYAWGGVGGTYFWVDPKEDLFVVFMSQAPSRREHYRSLLRDMVYAALLK